MSIDFLESAGIGSENIKAIKQAGIEITTAEIINNRCFFYGAVVKAIELATRGGDIRDIESCKQIIDYAIKTHNK